MGLFSSLFGKEYVEKCLKDLYCALKKEYGERAKENGEFFDSRDIWDMKDLRDKYSTDGKGAFGNIRSAHIVKFWYEKKSEAFFMSVSGTVRGETRTHRAMEKDNEPGEIHILLDY